MTVSIEDFVGEDNHHIIECFSVTVLYSYIMEGANSLVICRTAMQH